MDTSRASRARNIPKARPNPVVNRTQFPLVVAEAITIHKSQGGTYNTAIVELPETRMQRALMYVACSRATSSDGLNIVGSSFRKTEPPKATDAIALELARQQSIRLETRFRHLQTAGSLIQVIFHNVQSLPAHLNQIVSDPLYLQSDVLLFAETWCTTNHNLLIPGFKEIARADMEGQPKPVGAPCFVKEALASEVSLVEQHVRMYHSGTASVAAFAHGDTAYIAVYFSSTLSQMNIIEELDPLLRLPYPRILLAGDLTPILLVPPTQRRPLFSD